RGRWCVKPEVRLPRIRPRALQAIAMFGLCGTPTGEVGATVAQGSFFRREVGATVARGSFFRRRVGATVARGSFFRRRVGATVARTSFFQFTLVPTVEWTAAPPSKPGMGAPAGPARRRPAQASPALGTTQAIPDKLTPLIVQLLAKR